MSSGITWTGTGGLFTRLGKIMKAFNALEGLQLSGAVNLPAMLAEVLAAYDGREDITEGLSTAFGANVRSIDSWKAKLASYATATVQDLAEALGATSTSTSDVITALLAAMATDAQMVKANAVVVGSVTPDEDNDGDGKLIVSCQDVTGKNYETLRAETLRVVCLADAASGGAVEDAEAFRVYGGLVGGSALSYSRGGTGQGARVAVANASGANCLLNGEFESYATANTPDNWTISAGAAGTNVFNEAAGLSGHCLKLAGDGATAAVTLTQLLTYRRLSPLTKYAVGCWIKTAGVTQGTVKLRLAGTGFTPGVAEKIEIASAWPTAWTFKSFFINTPRVVPSDLALIVEITGTPNSGALVYVDRLALVPTTQHYALSLALFAGASPFIAGDRFTFTTTNDGAGKVQTCFGRFFGVTLPSDNAGH